MIQAAKEVFDDSHHFEQLSKKRRTSTTTASFTYFFALPEEISFHIISFLDAHDLCEVAKASRDLRRMAQENLNWKRLCKLSGWRISRDIAREALSTTGAFDYKKYFSEKAAMNRKSSITWTSTPKTSGVALTKRFKHSATSFGKYVIFIGGQETDTKRFNEVVYFDTESGTFTRPTLKGDQPPNFSRHSAALVNGRIFIFGGFDGFGTNFELAIFNPVTYTWTNVSRAQVRGDAPPSRTNHAAAAVGNKMYIFGGNNNDANGRYQVLDDFYSLDTDTLTWTNLTTAVGGERPTQRSGHTLTSIGNKLYLFGGGVWNETNGWVHKYNDIYVFDAAATSWSKPTCTGLIDTSTFSISFAVGRFLFVFGGGSKPKHCVTNDLYVLDTSSYTWSAPVFEEAAKPPPRDMGTACLVGSNVYVMGGYAGGAVDYFNKLSFDAKPVFESQTWVPLPGSGAY